MYNLFRESVRFDAATAAIKGGRAYQEDSIATNFPLGQETGFAVLADGMGGHLSGNVASALVMSEAFARLKMNETKLEDETVDIPTMLTEIASAANDRVTRHIAEDPETHGMGSTLLAALIKDRDLFWVSIGDSPLFLFRDNVLRQLNKDHSMAPQIDMMVKIGAMKPEVGRNHPDRNTLTSAITGNEIEKIDCPTEPTALQPGDVVIVASDGLQFLSNIKIQDILQATQSKNSIDITDALLQAVDDLDHPEQDNTAFTVIKMGHAGQAVETPDTGTPVKDVGPTHPIRTIHIDPVAAVAKPTEAEKTVERLIARSSSYRVQPKPDPVQQQEAVPSKSNELPRKVVVAAPAETRIVRLVASRSRLTEPKVAPCVSNDGPKADEDAAIKLQHDPAERQTHYHRRQK